MSGSTMDRMKAFLLDHKHLMLVILFIFPLYMTWTFDHSLWNPDETRDAGIASEMFKGKDFVVPRLNGEAFLEKPPLFYWSASLIYAVFGQVTGGLTRLPSALYGFLGILITFLIGNKLFNGSVGFVAVVLAGLVIAIDYLLRKEPKKILVVTMIGAPLFLVLVLPWLYSLWKSGGVEYLNIFLIDNNWNRFFPNSADHQAPFYFYLGSFLVDFLPWTFLFVGAAVSFIQNRKRDCSNTSKRFMWIWFLGIFIFLSISKGKRSIYLLPIFPAAALIVSLWYEEFCAQGFPHRLGRILIYITAFLILLIGGAVLGGHAIYNHAYLSPAIGFILWLGAVALVVKYALEKKGWNLFLAVFLVFLFSSFAANRFFIKELDSQRTFVPFCEAVKDEMAGADLLGIQLNEMERGVFPFYIGKPIHNFNHVEELSAYISNNADKKLLLISSKNKNELLPPSLKNSMTVLYLYRPNEKRRSYLLYSNESVANKNE